MTLENLCDLFDDHVIFDKQSDLNNDDYYASSSKIITDGKYHSTINRNGYIHITSVEGETPDTMANYIMFLGQNGLLFLAIYRYCPEHLYKDIVKNLNILREQFGMRRLGGETNTYSPGATAPSEEDLMSLIREDPTCRLIDLNTFKCENCCSSEIVYYKNPKTFTLYGKCKKCDTLYKLIPSCFYRIKEKTSVFRDGAGKIKVPIIDSEGKNINKRDDIYKPDKPK